MGIDGVDMQFESPLFRGGRTSTAGGGVTAVADGGGSCAAD